jgi:hypothetical protein
MSQFLGMLAATLENNLMRRPMVIAHPNERRADSVCADNLNAGVAVMKSAQDGA